MTVSVLQTLIGMLVADGESTDREVIQAGAANIAGQLRDAQKAVAAEAANKKTPDVKGAKVDPDYALKTLQGGKQKQSNLESDYFQSMDLATRIQGKLNANAATRATCDDSAKTGNVVALSKALAFLNMPKDDRQTLILASAAQADDKRKASELAAALEVVQAHQATQAAPAAAPAEAGPSNGKNGKTAPAAASAAPAA